MAKKTTTDESPFDNLRGGTISTQMIPESDKLICVQTLKDGLLMYPISIVPVEILETIKGLDFE